MSIASDADSSRPPGAAAPADTAHAATLLLVDVVNSTGLGARLGHQRGDVVIAQAIATMVEVVEQAGVVVRQLGDGLLARFAAASAGLDAAAAIHRAVARLSDDLRLVPPLRVRIALDASDLAIVDDEIRGVAPVTVARMEPLIPASETWCSEAVRLLARGRGRHDMESLGSHELRGVDEPLQLHRVRVGLADAVGMPGALDGIRRFRFVGRTAEMATLDAAWRRAVSGVGSVMVVAGEPGIGKTRLARETALAARQNGGLVLFGRCPPDSAEAFAPFTQMLRTVVDRAGNPAAVLGPGASELARIVPAIAAAIPGLRRARNEDPATDRFQLFEAVAGWLTTLARHAPVLVVIDDLSWADEPTVQLLRHLAARLATERVLIVATYRISDARPAAREFARLLPEGVARLDVAGLDPTAVLGLVEDALEGTLLTETRPLVAAIGAQAGGNPFYLGEVVASLRDQGKLQRGPTGDWYALASAEQAGVPPAVGEMIANRVEQLSDACRSTLQLAAVIGQGFAGDVLLELSVIDPAALADALDEAVDAYLLREVGAGYEFHHSLVHRAIYDRMSATRRRIEHRRVGLAIEMITGSDVGTGAAGDGAVGDDVVEALAFQFEHGYGADDAARAIAYLRRAGAAADRRLAYDHAAGCFRRALDLLARTPSLANDELRCDLLIELGTALRRSGDDGARRTLLDACATALALSDAERAAAAVLGAGRGTFSVAGTIEPERVDMLRQTLELVGPDASPTRARLLATLSSELAFDDDPTSGDTDSDEALAIARELSDPGLLVTVLGLRLVGLWRADMIGVRLAHAAELEQICLLAGDARRGKFLSAMTVCCQAVMEAGDMGSADRMLGWLDETSQTLRQPTSLGYAKLRLASRACIAGRFDEAEQLADEAYFYCSQSGQPDAEVFHTGQIFTIRLHQGRADDVIDAMASAAKQFPGIVAFAAGEAACAADLGDTARCRKVIGPVLAGLDGLRFDLNWLTTLCLASHAVHHLGDVTAAAKIRTMIGPYRHLFVDNASAFFGSAHHYDALLCATLDLVDEAAVSFAAAAAAHTALRSPPWLARTYAEHARSGVAGADDHTAEAARLAREFGLGRVAALVAR